MRNGSWRMLVIYPLAQGEDKLRQRERHTHAQASSLLFNYWDIRIAGGTVGRTLHLIHNSVSLG
jgi:hypothetical protein